MHGLLPLLLMAPVFAPANEPDLTKASLELFESSLNSVKDYTFTFEGETKRRPRLDPDRDGSDAFDHVFQGTFSFRTHDGAMVLDRYLERPRSNAPMEHETFASLGGAISASRQIPDMDKATATPAKSQGNLPNLNPQGSPHVFSTFWLMRQVLLDPVGWDFQCLGWENLKGTRYVRARMNALWGASYPNKPLVHLWLDFERGGFPVRIDRERNGVITQRTDQIQVARVSVSPSQKIWFPISGRTVTFSLQGGEGTGTHIITEYNAFVDGSIVFNQGLLDRDYSFDSKSRLIRRTNLRLARKFEQIHSVQPERGILTDADGVARALRSRLDVANLQSAELDASSGSSEVKLIVTYVSIVALFVAVILFVIRIVRGLRCPSGGRVNSDPASAGDRRRQRTLSDRRGAQ